MTLDVNWLAIAVVILVVVGLFVVLRLRSPATGRRQRHDERAEEIARELGTLGLATERGAEVPPEVARLDLGRPRAGLAVPWLLRAGSGEGEEVVVFDQEVRRGRSGWNEEYVSENRIYRHTLVGVRSPRLALPAFDLVPNLRGMVGTGVSERMETLRQQDSELHSRVEGSRAARLMLRAADGLMALEERSGALDLAERPQLAAAYRAFGDAGEVLPLLFDGAVGALLLEQPGILASGEGEWLLVTRNVRVAFDPAEPDPGLPLGLLTPARTTELVTVALRLEELLRR
jgi:hypothetical protein